MKYEEAEDVLELSSGKRLFANRGILGISPAGEISEGYDGGVYDEFTPEERAELAEYMIGLWRQWAGACS